jgi:hypothetical protein
MIEVQIKDKALYERLKEFSSYHSDLTGVCAFRPELFEMLKENGVEMDEAAVNEVNAKKPLPSITIVKKNVIKLENAPAEMLYFCGVRSEFDPTVSVRFMHEIDLILRNRLVRVDKRFLEVYSKLGYRDKISTLVCSKVPFKGKGKLIDFIDGSLTLQSMKFPDVAKKDIKYKQMLVKIISHPSNNPTESLVVLEGDRYNEAYAVECNRDGIPLQGKLICLRFYNRPLILKSILFTGNKINIACQKISEINGDTLMCYDPLVLPKGLSLDGDTAYSPPNRSIPADLYRNALFEFQCRYDFVYGEEEQA